MPAINFAGPVAATKIQNMIDAIEDAIKSKLEGA